ncbi:Wadjet anti-phage system protein JetD domain-containing protein [Actinopolymorpha sp. B17G11]|uniref:Wadjet anti-phage system protein JetD domain-containing protein n=1 Tax=unclassified Actinopolymorpha TaxID=2627063 RepID=UPI0032D98E3A
MSAWTTPADVERKLRRRWDAGTFLSAYGEGRPWEPFGLSVRGPAVSELGADLAKVQDWARSWRRAGRRFRIEHRRVGGRLIGANELPAKAWIDSYDQLWAVLGVEREAAAFADLVADARSRAPRLVAWMIAHPLKVLPLESDWPAIVETVRWIDAHPSGEMYVRQIDVPGVDTKFVERHRAVLAELLDHQLAEDRVDRARSPSDFARRYGFRRRPDYLRIRALGGERLRGGFSEITVRAEELASAPLECTACYVIENEITYLAFPDVADAIAVFGGGYAVSLLEGQEWLADRELIYWGDIDTHGLAILDRLRRRFPHTRSMLMDRATLLAHEGQWASEAKQVVTSLDALTQAESALYRDLVEETFGTGVRLEQERISYAAITRALASISRRVA